MSPLVSDVCQYFFLILLLSLCTSFPFLSVLLSLFSINISLFLLLFLPFYIPSFCFLFSCLFLYLTNFFSPYFCFSHAQVFSQAFYRRIPSDINTKNRNLILLVVVYHSDWQLVSLAYFILFSLQHCKVLVIIIQSTRCEFLKKVSYIFNIAVQTTCFVVVGGDLNSVEYLVKIH